MMDPLNDRIQQQPRIRLARRSEAYGDSVPIGSVAVAAGTIATCETTLPLIAEYGGQVVARVNLTLAEAHTGLIHGLWVDAEWVETMLPLRMMVAVLEQCRTLGCLKVDMDPGVRGLAVIAMLLDSGLLMNRPVHAAVDEPAKAMSCYLNLYQDASSVLT